MTRAFVDVIASTDPLVGIERGVAAELTHIAHLQGEKLHANSRNKDKHMGKFDHILPKKTPPIPQIRLCWQGNSLPKQPLGFFSGHVTENDAIRPDLDFKIIAKGIKNIYFNHFA